MPLPLPVQIMTRPLRFFLSIMALPPGPPSLRAGERFFLMRGAGEHLGEWVVGVQDVAQGGPVDRLENRGADHVRRGAVRDQRPLVQEQDAVGVEGGEVQVVQDGDHGQVALPAQSLDEVEHGLCLRRIEMAGRLVQQEDVRFLGQRERQSHPLLLTAGEGLQRRSRKRSVSVSWRAVSTASLSPAAGPHNAPSGAR